MDIERGTPLGDKLLAWANTNHDAALAILEGTALVFKKPSKAEAGELPFVHAAGENAGKFAVHCYMELLA